MPSSFATRAIGRDVSITILTASSLNSDEKLFFGRGNYFTFPEVHPNGWTVRKLRGTPVGGAAGRDDGVRGRRDAGEPGGHAGEPGDVRLHGHCGAGRRGRCAVPAAA